MTVGLPLLLYSNSTAMTKSICASGYTMSVYVQPLRPSDCPITLDCHGEVLTCAFVGAQKDGQYVIS